MALQTLGTGSFGRVKLAEHKLTGCKVALKFINRKKVATPESVVARNRGQALRLAAG